MFDELDMLRQGTSNDKKTTATSKICSTILESVKVELEMHKFLQANPGANTDHLPVLGAPIDLGT
jgi:hypothetical protein